jgi:hypothetical protein
MNNQVGIFYIRPRNRIESEYSHFYAQPDLSET